MELFLQVFTVYVCLFFFFYGNYEIKVITESYINGPLLHWFLFFLFFFSSYKEEFSYGHKSMNFFSIDFFLKKKKKDTKTTIWI